LKIFRLKTQVVFAVQFSKLKSKVLSAVV